MSESPDDPDEPAHDDDADETADESAADATSPADHDDSDDVADADSDDVAAGDSDDAADTTTAADHADTATADPDGGSTGSGQRYCSSCGEPIKEAAEICPECGVRQEPAGSSGKDRVTAGILALLLGGIGAHKFYLEETRLGILYLCFSWTLIPALIGFIEGILYLTKSDVEFERQYVN